MDLLDLEQEEMMLVKRHANDMSGKYYHNVDAKGRVFVPAKFRDNFARPFRIGYGNDGCIRLYTDVKWATIAHAFEKVPAKRRNEMRKTFAAIESGDLDTQGRVTLSESLRDQAGIKDKVVVVGMGQWAEIWDPDRFDEIMANTTDDDVDECFEELGIS